MSFTYKLIHGDAIEEMSKIKDGSIDLILSDPPYGTMKNASLDGWSNRTTDWDEVLPQKLLMKHCNRVLRVGGCMVLFAQDPYTTKLIVEQHPNVPFSYRYVWKKDHFANALIAKKAPVKYTEDVLVFYKKYDTMNLHPLREYSKTILLKTGKTLGDINSEMGHRRAEHFFYVESTQFGLCTKKTYHELIERYELKKVLGDDFLSYPDMMKIDKTFKKTFNLPKEKKFKSNVLEYKKDYGGLHPTQKPILLLEDIIKTHSNSGDTVLDFAMGSGSTIVACKNTKRNGIGIELNDKYFDIATKRIKK